MCIVLMGWDGDCGVLCNQDKKQKTNESHDVEIKRGRYLQNAL